MEGRRVAFVRSKRWQMENQTDTQIIFFFSPPGWDYIFNDGVWPKKTKH